MRPSMPSTTTPPTRCPAAISSFMMFEIASAVCPLDTAVGGAAAAGAGGVAQATSAWHSRPIRRSRNAGRMPGALRRFWLDLIGRVNVARVPQHPSVGTGVTRRLDLLADLVGAEHLAADGVVGDGVP